MSKMHSPYQMPTKAISVAQPVFDNYCQQAGESLGHVIP